MATEIRETRSAAGVSNYVRVHFLCSFAQSRKAPVYFVLSVRLCVGIIAALTGRISLRLIPETVIKICRESRNLVKIWQKYRAFRMKFYCRRRQQIAVQALTWSEMVIRRDIPVVLIGTQVSINVFKHKY